MSAIVSPEQLLVRMHANADMTIFGRAFVVFLIPVFVNLILSVFCFVVLSK